MAPKIHITGASDTGTTTLGVELARRLNIAHLDTDTFFWAPTRQPYATMRSAKDRLAMIEAEAGRHDGWVISGSLVGWGHRLARACDLVVFLYAPADIRIARILEREAQRHGADIEPGGRLNATHKGFLKQARSYDDPGSAGRSLAGHRAWLKALSCPVLVIRGTPSVSESADRVLKAVRARGFDDQVDDDVFHSRSQRTQSTT